jgi:hypothetical protein
MVSASRCESGDPGLNPNGHSFFCCILHFESGDPGLNPNGHSFFAAFFILHGTIFAMRGER